MAKLSTDQILKLIIQPKNADKIHTAVKHSQRLALYCDEVIEENKLSPYYKEVILKIAKILPEDVFARFKDLIRVPLPYTSFTSHIYTELSKVFDSQNPFFKWEFKNPEYEADYQEYRKSHRLIEYWRTKGVENVKFNPDSFLIVDLPAEQTSLLPEPYFYIVKPNDQKDYELSEFGETEYLIVHQGQYTDGIYKGKEKYLVIDSEKYVYATDKAIVQEVFHNKGFCPALKFWKGNTNPITLQLGNLDWLFFFEHAKRYLDLYGPFPVYSGYIQSCQNVVDGYKCEGGMVGDTACKACNGTGHAKLKLGVGSFHGVEAPGSKEDADLRNPIQRLDADIASVTWVTQEVVRLYEEIEKDCIGTDGEAGGTQAKNEDQIKSSWESRKSKLIGFKEGIERIQKFTEDTICKFRYNDSFISSTFNYGTEYYLKSISDLNQDYTDAKESGQPNFVLSKKRDVIFSSEYKDNPDEATRINVLKQLEPWQDYSIKECKDLGFDTLYKEDFVLKAYFNTFIMQFEREVGSIVTFGSLIDFNTKINIIREKLNFYVNEKISQNGNTTTNASNSGQNGSNANGAA